MNATIDKPAEATPTPRKKRRWGRILLVPLLLALVIGGQLFYTWTNESLIAAVMEGDADRVHLMLNLRADPNARLASPGVRVGPVSRWDRFLAMFGVRRSNQSTDRWRTVLMLAASTNNADVVNE